MTPPPPRTNAWRFANSIAFSAAAFRPTVELNTTVLYCFSVSRSRNGLVGSETPAGACRPGPLLMFGSQMSTSKPFSAPSCWNIAVEVDDRLVPEAAGAAVDEHLVRRAGIGDERRRVEELPDRLDRPASAAPTVTPVPLVSTGVPCSWAISACTGARRSAGSARGRLLERTPARAIGARGVARASALALASREQRAQLGRLRGGDERPRVGDRHAGRVRLRQRRG